MDHQVEVSIGPILDTMYTSGLEDLILCKDKAFIQNSNKTQKVIKLLILNVLLYTNVYSKIQSCAE